MNRRLKIFVSSPGDVIPERQVARKVIGALNEEMMGKVFLVPILWEQEPLLASGTFQTQIDPPEEVDILLGILWSRIGSPLPKNLLRDDGTRYESGTAFELESALTRYHDRKKPDVLLYRKLGAPSVSLENKKELMERLEQMELLDVYIKNNLQADDGSYLAAFHTFTTEEQFEEILKTHLRKLIFKQLENSEEPESETAPTTGMPVTDSAVPSVSSDVPRVVVQPFRSRTNDEELSSFAEGLTEDITSGLAQFSHLSVGASNSDSRSHQRFTVEGSLRKAGRTVRASIKLLETGSHVWAEQFDFDLDAGDVFEAQDVLTDRIVATLADPSGVLTRSLVAWVKQKDSTLLSAHECVLWTFGYLQQWRRDEHLALRTALERAIEEEPAHADARACLSMLYVDEHRLYFNPRPGALDRALDEAQRAVELDATSQLANRAMAEAHYFRRELGACRVATDRVLKLNPRDTSTIAMAGLLIAFAGDWEAGKTVVERGVAMNPHHAGWFHGILMWYYYRQRKYKKALAEAEQWNMPWYPWNHAGMAICHAQLGNVEEARKHLDNLLKLSPRYGKIARLDLSKWFVSEEHVEHALEGFVKAGLAIDDPV